MTWPAPTLRPPDAPRPPAGTPLPPPTARPGATTVPPFPSGGPGSIGGRSEPSELRVFLRTVPPAVWIALLGAALVLGAAGIVVANSWDRWGALAGELRALALVLLTVGLAWASERLRRAVPTTAAVLAHVATFLVAPAGVAFTSMLGGTWPACLTIGGLFAAGATEWQSTRWNRRPMCAGQVIALAMAAAGFAALTGSTAGLVAAVTAVVLVLAGAHGRAAALAVVAVLSPVLWPVAAIGLGSGTLAEVGVVGERLGWSGHVVGILACVVLAGTARRRGSTVLLLAGAAAPVVGSVTSLAAAGGSLAAWAVMPVFLVVLGEAAWWMSSSGVQRRVVTKVVDVPVVLMTVAGLVAPATVALLGLVDEASALAAPAIVAAAALAAVAMRWSQEGRRGVDLVTTAALACVVGTALAMSVPGWATVGVALACAAWSPARCRTGAVAVHVPAMWASVMLIALELPTAVTVASWCTLVALVVGSRARTAGEAGMRGVIEMSLVAPFAGWVAAVCLEAVAQVAFPTAVAIVVALTVTLEHRLARWSIPVAGASVLFATTVSTGPDGVDGRVWLGWLATTAAYLVAARCSQRRELWYAAAASSVLTVAVATLGAGRTPEEVLVGAMLATVALTGLAATMARRTPLDSAAIAAGGVVVAMSMAGVGPLWASAAWCGVGLQAFAYGVIGRQPLLRLAGAAVTALSAASTWFTSGAHARVLEALAPYDVRGGDVWALVAVLAAFAAGAAARAATGGNSWVTYSAGLAIGTLWLTSVQIERDAAWAIPMALTFGIATAAIGAWRRLAALLVGGTAQILLTLLLATGGELLEVPTWGWLAVGGLLLLAVAVAVERTGRRGTAATLRDLAERWN